MDTTFFQELKLRLKENNLFLNRFLRHPKQLGTLAPISPKLARLAANQVKTHDDEIIIEIGSGTGRLTRALLKNGVKPKNLIAVELDKEFCHFMRLTLPELRVIEGDAIQLPTLIPQEYVGKVSTVISIIPLMYLSLGVRKAIIEACLKVLKPGGTIHHVTYSPASPLSALDLRLHAQRVITLWLNLPPGFVWKYQPVLTSEHNQ